jgi:hypothetical protein
VRWKDHEQSTDKALDGRGCDFYASKESFSLSQSIRIDTEENQENLDQNGQYIDRISNGVPPECKSLTLPL